MADPRIRNIKIKTGVVKRIAKEKTMYEKESEQLFAKVEKMKADGKDEHDIKKQDLCGDVCVLLESSEDWVDSKQVFFLTGRANDCSKYANVLDLEVLQESRVMVPDALKRLKTAHDELIQLLESEKDLNETDEYTTAKKTLEDATAVM